MHCQPLTIHSDEFAKYGRLWVQKNTYHLIRLNTKEVLCWSRRMSQENKKAVENYLIIIFWEIISAKLWNLPSFWQPKKKGYNLVKNSTKPYMPRPPRTWHSLKVMSNQIFQKTTEKSNFWSFFLEISDIFCHHKNVRHSAKLTVTMVGV